MKQQRGRRAVPHYSSILRHPYSRSEIIQLSEYAFKYKWVERVSILNNTTLGKCPHISPCELRTGVNVNCNHKSSANNDIPTLNYHKEVPQLWGVTAATALFMLRNIRDARGCQEPFLTSFTTKMALILSDKNISGCFVFLLIVSQRHFSFQFCLDLTVVSRHFMAAPRWLPQLLLLLLAILSAPLLMASI